MESLEIQGFRGFGHLIINRLGRVNLIVGQNNVGKSSLLEALRLYGTRGTPWVVRSMLSSRDDLPPMRFGRARESNALTVEQLFRMFYLHNNPTTAPESIVIGPLEKPGEQLTIRLAWFGSSPSEKGGLEWQPITVAPDESVWNYRPAWLIEARGGTWRPLFLDTLADPRGFLKRTSEPLQYLSASGFGSSELGRLFDAAAMENRLKDAVAALRLISPDVEDLLLVGENYSRQVMVKLRGQGEHVPLTRLGDGMNRILGIVLALVNAKGGMLLVDEVETGIHYSVMGDLWKLIFHAADELQVQVFASTHSWDCIQGFQKAATWDRHNLGMLVRLERRKSGVHATLFDEEELAIATRENIEVR